MKRVWYKPSGLGGNTWHYGWPDKTHLYGAVIHDHGAGMVRVSVFASPDSVRVSDNKGFNTLDEAKAWATAIVETQ